MDDHRFDTFTRVLGAEISRRRTLTVLATAISGGALLAAPYGEAVALSRKQRRRCKRDGGTVCSAGTKRECCSSTSGPDDPGTCVHGACSCDATQTFAEDNGCPMSAAGRCGCFPYVGESFPKGACANRLSECNLEKPCDTNANCGSGSVCLPTCADETDPQGPRRCSNPCRPA
jgi:hypothetical protein